MKKVAILFSAVALLAAAQTTGAQTLEKVQETVQNLRLQKAPDKRQTLFDVNAEALADGHIYVTGRISDAANYDALAYEIKALGGNVSNHVVLIPDTMWAIVRVPVACMRTDGRYGAELATQALMGMPVRLLDNKNGWWLVQSPDGYLGWMYGSSFSRKSPQQLEQWRDTPRLVVTSLTQIAAYDSPKAISPRSVVTDLVPGNIVEGTLKSPKNGRVEVTLPDGRTCWADAKALTPIEQWASQPFDADVILNQAYSMMGAPYLWGGTSAKTTDCSGLVKISYLANGRILRRDASQQALIGLHIDPSDTGSLQPADLMFFGDTPGGRVTHVALYDNDKYFIHCAGRVHRSHIDPEDSTFGRREYMGASRINGYDGTEGITRAIDHPWLFNK